MNDNGFEIILDLSTWAVIGGTFVPILVGVLTKVNLHGGVKAVVNLVLSCIVGLIATAQTTDGVLSQEAIFAAGLALVTSMAMHFGVWKPMEVTGSSGVVQRATARFGLGGERAKSTEEIVRTRTR